MSSLLKRILVSLVLSAGMASPAAAGIGEAIEAYEAGDYAAAYGEFLPLAVAGDATAQYYLGWMYEAGEGVEPDYADALPWYRKAAA